MVHATMIKTAQRAYDSVKIYRMIYGRRPRIATDIPFISHVQFHRARSVLDCVADMSDIHGAVPSYIQGSQSLPLTPVENGEEWSYRLNRLASALEYLGLPVNHQRYRFLIVADERTGVFASYFSDQLGWLRHQASLTYVDFPGFNLQREVQCLDPHAVLLMTSFGLDFAESGARLINLLNINQFWQQTQEYDRLLFCDELHVIGACRAGEEDYHYDHSLLFLERDPVSDRLAVTLPDFSCWPWIRFTIGPSGLPTFRPIGDG